ncbi:MAG: phospho-N-acetylmuramoyl-pentapeptide-transferase [Anaplasmataceae bacterium]|nr:phospho-N-acetylmuramoyl-pentapeptide-transferase [Anaplasmataceae bacterium]
MIIIQETIRVMVVMGAAFVLALLVTPVWLRFLENYKVGKQIRPSEKAPVFNHFHEKKAGTPTAGGVIIWGTVIGIALLLSLLSYFFGDIWSSFSFIDRRETYLPLAALLIAALLGLMDDLLGSLGIGANGGGFKVRYKLIIYFFIALIGAWWFYDRLGFREIAIPFAPDFVLGIWYIPVFIFVIVASAFSANETDGLDGLLGGTSLFTFGALTVVAFALGRYDLATFGGAMIGSLLAFLWHNIYPARFFMGDTGSMSLGITMGVIAMLTNTVLLLPLFAFIPVLESLSVIIQLTSKKAFGRKIFHSTPLHHHFEALHWHESKVTMRFWIISAMASGLGLVIFFLARLFSV